MIGIISDIHGNFPALQAVLNALEQLGVATIFCLGDVAGYYCQINECCEALRSRNIPTLLGNHDWYLASGEGCPRSNSANMCLEYQRSVLEEKHLAWLAGLPRNVQVDSLNMVHGGWKDFLDEYVVPTEDYFAGISGTYFASGHTHVPTVRMFTNKQYCNPGSVGQPRDGDSRASFAIFDGNSFTLHRTCYNIGKIQIAMQHAGFSSYFYENLEIGARIGGKIDKMQ